MSGNGNKPAKWNPVANSEATRFRKGQSGNPGGRPKGITRRALRDELRRDDADVGSVAHRFARAVIKHAEEGNSKYAEMVFEQADGPLPKAGESPAMTQQTAIVLPSWSNAREVALAGREEK